MSRNSAAIWIGVAGVLWFGLLRGVRAARVTFDKLRVVGVQPDGIVYRLRVLIHNPLLFDILVNNIEGTVYVMDAPVAVLNYPVNQRIRSWHTNAFDIQFTASADKLGEGLWQSIQTGDAHTLLITFDGFVTIKGIRIPIYKQFTYDEIMGYEG